MTLKLEHIAPYLPYKLKCKDCYGNTFTLSNIQIDSPTEARVNSYGGHGGLGLFNIKPFLRPLSELNSEIQIEGNFISPYDYLAEKYYTLDLHKQCERLVEDERWINQCDYILIQYLLEWHFDIYGLFEDDLAININEIK